MQSIKALEMLRENRINELMAKLEDEVYQDSLKKRPEARRRYTAMKRYFSYSDNPREVCQKPCEVEFEGRQYTSFTNSYSLVLTTEPTGEIELFDTANGTYPDVGRLIHFDGTAKKVNFAEVLAKAKAKGYKLRKSDFNSNHFLMRYNGIYFRMPLLDITFSMLDDGNDVTVYHEENSLRPMIFTNDIGIGVVLPIRYDGDPTLAGNIVIDVTEEGVTVISNEEISELINRRRRQILVHSIIYYNMDDNLISDSQWSMWAKELASLQERYPAIAENCVYADAYEGFDGSSGFDLPLDDPWAMHKAKYLLSLRDRRMSVA